MTEPTFAVFVELVAKHNPAGLSDDWLRAAHAGWNATHNALRSQLAEAEEIELQLAKQFEDASKRAEQANRDLATAQAQIAQLMKAMRDLMEAVTPALQKSFPKNTWAKQWEKAEQILAEPPSGETK